MALRHECSARQFSDQMQCAKCGLCWDMNDPEPPECKPVATPGYDAAMAQLESLRIDVREDALLMRRTASRAQMLATPNRNAPFDDFLDGATVGEVFTVTGGPNGLAHLLEYAAALKKPLLLVVALDTDGKITVRKQ